MLTTTEGRNSKVRCLDFYADGIELQGEGRITEKGEKGLRNGKLRRLDIHADGIDLEGGRRTTEKEEKGLRMKER